MLIISISFTIKVIDMLISFIRTLILYILIVVALRVMGKRQVGQLEPTELVVALMISDLAAIPMGHVSIPLAHGVIPILTLVVAEATLSFWDLKSRNFRKLLSGSPVVLIKSGEVYEKELEKLRINIDDLMEELRVGGYPDICEIQYAIFETNGNLSIIPKSSSRPATTGDLNLNLKYKGLPFMLVCDGKINKKALSEFEKDEKWLNKQIKLNGAKDIDEVLLAGVSESGLFYLQKRMKK